MTRLEFELCAAGLIYTNDKDAAEAALFWNIVDKFLPAVYNPVAYMDDVALTIISDAATIFEKPRKAIEIADSVFSRFHFRLNYKLGKTNLILNITGPDITMATT